jgi:hypothetical protein
VVEPGTASPIVVSGEALLQTETCAAFGILLGRRNRFHIDGTPEMPDVVGGTTFNASFSLTGVTVPGPIAGAGGFEAIRYKVPSLRHGQQAGPPIFCRDHARGLSALVCEPSVLF